ncbi:MAG: CAP domain-containing protein [Moorea sp. SIO2B7]|nr:CAP domain-containing protein [Moorena sp. SIO2B7]
MFNFTYPLIIILGMLLFVGCSPLPNKNLTTPTMNDFAPRLGLIASNSRYLTDLEQSIYQQINQYRQSRNLPPLKLDTRISQQAKIYSERIANGTINFKNNRLEERLQIIKEEIPYQMATANVSFNQGYAEPATQTVQGWIRSSGNRQNIEGDFDLTGIGISINDQGEYYFTQIFIKEVPVITAASLRNLEQQVHRQVNQYRKSLNLPPLRLDSRISDQSRIHSQWMARGEVPFSHDGFNRRVREIGQNISYRSAAENVAFNQGHSDPATVAVKGWIKSPGHHKNMVGYFDLTGIGVSRNNKGEYYFTQIFIKQR